MLPIIAAAGHSQYVKGARFYAQLMQMNLSTYSSVDNIFSVYKFHTVRYSKFEWSGIWTDLSIEQTLMRAIKSGGELTGGKLRNQSSAYKVWVSLLNYFSEIEQSLHDIQHNDSGENVRKNTIHVDVLPSSMKKDFSALKRLTTGSGKILTLIKKQIS